MIKKIFLFILIVLLILGAALFCLSRLIRPDEIRRQVLAKIEEATGAHVETGRVRLAVFPRPCVAIEGLNVESAIESSSVLFTADRLEIYTPMIPVVFPKNGGAPSFRIDSVLVRNGHLIWVDAKSSQKIELSRIEADIRDISPASPVSFAVKAAFEGPARNLECSGIFGPLVAPSSSRNLSGSFQLRLDQVNFDELKGRLPALRSLPLSGTPVLGGVAATITSVEFAETGAVQGIRGEATADFKELRLDIFKAPLRDIAAKAVMEGDRIRLEEGRGNLGDGSFTLTGEANSVFGQPTVHFKSSLRGVEVNDAMPPPAFPGAPEFQGKLNADLELEGRGADFAQAVSAANGSGQLEITEGVVRNLNLLASVFDKIAVIPMIGIEVRNYLSPRHRAIVTERDMAIRIAQSRFAVRQGNITVEQANIEGEAFLINGGGHISPRGGMRLNCGLFLSRELSTEVTRVLPDFMVLLDPYGRLLLPFSVVGEVKKPNVIVDTEYLTSKIVAAKGPELLGKVLKPGQDAGNQTGSLLKNLIK